MTLRVVRSRLLQEACPSSCEFHGQAHYCSALGNLAPCHHLLTPDVCLSLLALFGLSRGFRSAEQATAANGTQNLRHALSRGTSLTAAAISTRLRS